MYVCMWCRSMGTKPSPEFSIERGIFIIRAR